MKKIVLASSLLSLNKQVFKFDSLKVYISLLPHLLPWVENYKIYKKKPQNEFLGGKPNNQKL